MAEKPKKKKGLLDNRLLELATQIARLQQAGGVGFEPIIPGMPFIGKKTFRHTPNNVAVSGQEDTVETQIGNALLFLNRIKRPNVTTFGVESDVLRKVLLELVLRKGGGATLGVPGAAVSLDEEGIRLLKGDK